jgi:2'-5' RNA ligase
MRGQTPDFTDVLGPEVEVEITRVAKATGTKCGDGESVGLFIPLPKNLAKKFPSLGHEDTSPSHVTFLYIGEFKDGKKQGILLERLKDICRRWWPMCHAVLGDLDYFDQDDHDRRVPHVCVDFDKDLSGFKQRVKQELQDAGISVGDKFPEFKPHVTLAYMPGMDAKWKGRIPKGKWKFNEMEIWGLPKVHKIRLGPSIQKISEAWLRSKIKTAGWWRITPENPGVNLVPGKPANACPGGDPSLESYNGDGPADTMGDTMANINQQYMDAWGRPAKADEMKAVFDFVYGGFEQDPSLYLPKGKEISMRVAARYLEAHR